MIEKSEDAHKDCACLEHNTGAMTELEAIKAADSLDGWTLLEFNGHLKLEKTYKLNREISAMFISAMHEPIKTNDHHPEVTVKDMSIQFLWWTHKVNGLTDLDFLMAQNTDIAFHQIDETLKKA